MGGGHTVHLEVGLPGKNACLTSPERKVRRWWIASETMRRSSTIEITGAKESLVDHSCGSRLPNATIRHLARFGEPSSSYLTVEMAIVGRVGPTMCFMLLYSVSVIVDQAGRSCKPKYSSSTLVSKCLGLRDGACAY